MWGLLWVVSGLALAAPPEAEVVAALLPRHGQASCADLARQIDAGALTAALVAVAEGVEHPPWVPMRAARCVVEAAAEDPLALRAAEAWLRDEARPGLALMVTQGLDSLEPEAAVPLADLAIARGRVDSRFAAYASAALLRSRHPEVVERGRTLSLPGSVR